MMTTIPKSKRGKNPYRRGFLVECVLLTAEKMPRGFDAIDCCTYSWLTYRLEPKRSQFTGAIKYLCALGVLDSRTNKNDLRKSVYSLFDKYQ